jgi:hypothetical protein
MIEVEINRLNTTVSDNKDLITEPVALTVYSTESYMPKEIEIAFISAAVQSITTVSSSCNVFSLDSRC